MAQFTLFTHKGGPNGWKVAYVLEELGLTYEAKYLGFQKGEQKAEEHVKFNPNGRIPTLIDHKNNDFTVWESDAILVYLAEKYDPEHKISAATAEEKIHQLQWLFFQSSGQGPYFGQAAWFTYYHPEKIPSAVERYKNEIKRVLGVLDAVLAKQEWLVTGKATIADISFITWDNFALKLLGEEFDFAKEFPHTAAWHKKLTERPAIKKVDEVRAAVNAA